MGQEDSVAFGAGVNNDIMIVVYIDWPQRLANAPAMSTSIR